MADVVGVCFRRAGKVYNFDTVGTELSPGDFVVVDTAHGLEMGQVVTKSAQVSDNETNKNLKAVVRKATDEDVENADRLRLKEKEALM